MLTIAEKIKSFERQIVVNHSYRQAYAMLEKAVESTRLRGIPTSAVLIGPSGSGKSTLACKYRDSYPAPNTEARADGLYRTIPAFYCTVPARVTIKSFCKTILTGLECMDLRGDTVELELRIIQLLKTCGVQVVIFDEFQILADPENEKQLKGVIDWLLSILNRIDIPVLIVGTRECKEIIYREDRLARRYPFLATLDYLRYDQSIDSNYMIVLGRLDEKLYEIGNLNPGLHLTDPSIATRLYVATRGNLEYIRQILSTAFTICLTNHSKGLELSDFYETCQLHVLKLSLSQADNPFDLSISACTSLIESIDS